MDFLVKNDHIPKALIEIETVCQPTSIFLYGSRARTDAKTESDYEIGVLLSEKTYVTSSVLREAIKNKNVSAYPFRFEKFIALNPDTPFNKNIYMRELIMSGKTLKGENIIENLPLPNIEILDVFSDAQFNLGYALASVVAHKEGSSKLASLLFYKSCLFATRALLMIDFKKLLLTYDSIVEESKKIDLGEYGHLISHAYDVRNGKKYEPTMLYKNISYLNQFVISKIKSRFEKEGNQTLF